MSDNTRTATPDEPQPERTPEQQDRDAQAQKEYEADGDLQRILNQAATGPNVARPRMTPVFDEAGTDDWPHEMTLITTIRFTSGGRRMGRTSVVAEVLASRGERGLEDLGYVFESTHEMAYGYMQARARF